MSELNDSGAISLEIDRAVLGPYAPKPTSLSGQRERSAGIWQSPDGSCRTGIWECEPGRFAATRVGYDEICHILSGSATVTSAGAEPIELVPGSVLITPEGWEGEWEVHETLSKLFIIRSLT